MTFRLSLLFAVALGWIGAAQAQWPDQSHGGLNPPTGAQTVVACGPGDDKKDPP